MNIYDISMTIDEKIPVYKNFFEKKPTIITRATHDSGNHHESSIMMDLHTGTHIDAPLHMVKNGKTMDIYNIEDFITVCKVLDFSGIKDKITKSDLEGKDISADDFILLKTENSYTNEFKTDFVYLSSEGAAYLKEKKIKGVGTDGLGIERSQPNHETHQILLNHKIMIVEGLRLKDVPEGIYTLIILPIKILNTEAAPARAILVENVNLF